MNFVEQLDSSICAADDALEYCTEKSPVSKRKKEWKGIIDGAALKHKKLLKKIRH